jgi:hypothetical protein
MSDETAGSIQKVDSYDSIVTRQRAATDFSNSIGQKRTFGIITIWLLTNFSKKIL